MMAWTVSQRLCDVIMNLPEILTLGAEAAQR
jgi:hypothetical protein